MLCCTWNLLNGSNSSSRHLQSTRLRQIRSGEEMDRTWVKNGKLDALIMSHRRPIDSNLLSSERKDLSICQCRDQSFARVHPTKMPGACRCDPSLSHVRPAFCSPAARPSHRCVPSLPAKVGACDDTRAHLSDSRHHWLYCKLRW